MKEKFENWLITEDGKTINTAYSYKNAINKLSKHYSELKGKNVDFYFSDQLTLKKAETLYSLDGNESKFGGNSKGINRNAIVALNRFYATFPIMSARNFYKEIEDTDIEEAFNIVEISKIDLKNLRDYGVENIKTGNVYPPKNLIRIIARTKQISLDNDTFFGGEANEPFKNRTHICKFITLKNDDLDLNKLILNAIESDFIQMLKNEKQYYFQHLLNIKDTFLNFSVEEVVLQDILSNYNNYKEGTFESFVDTYNGLENKFLNIIGEFVSYLDEKASGKNKWNRYNPSRTIAQAGVRQDNWVKHLLAFKINPDHTLSNSIKNALSYSISPSNHLTVLSENHRRKLSEFLLKEEYDELNFTQKFIDFFNEFDIKVENQLNYTYLISSIMYDEDIEPLWKPKTQKEEAMEIAEIFEQFRKFLYKERSELTSGTRKAYLDHAVSNITSSYKALFNKDIQEVNIDYGLVKELSLVLRNISGYTGIASFRQFINHLSKKHLQSKNTTLNKIYFGPPGTGKTFRIIEDYIIAAETHIEKVDATKQIIDLKKGFWHLAPGEGGYLWEDLKKNDYLGYEWCSHYLGDLSKVSRDEPHWDMKKRFSKVKEGDYICIISGKKFYALAKALHGYDLNKSKNLAYDFQTIKVEWVKKFEQPELLNTYSTQSFSNLKGSKRWQSLLDALESQDIYPKEKEGKEVKKSVKNYSLVSFHQSFSYEDFIEGIKPDLENEDNDESDIRYIIQDGIFKQSCDKAARLAGYEDLNSCIEDTKEGRLQSFQNAPPFYLLIDEINRGNISAIFGELITLIEKDKRLGNDYELMTDLPYSKKQFGVPANLHIIGTMNTADRSVEALDTALRRRFSFIEVAPNTVILKDKHPTSGIIESDINLIKLLDKINERIELLINKDHKIGHSYFLKISSLKELKKVFTDKVIPLLEEYFYGDYGKIGLVLGSCFVEKVEDKSKTDFADFSYEDKQALREKMIYKFTSHKGWTPKDFISIYNSAILKEVE